MVAELMRDNKCLGSLSKKAPAPTGKREAVDYLVGEERLPVRVACEAIDLAQKYLLQKPLI